jgi:hypothetical protein
MKSNTETLRLRIHRVLGRFQIVQAAYLFGSHAEGRSKPGSDVDLALVGPRDQLQAHKLDILADLTAEGLDRVDLVLLDGADPALRFEAVHPNCLIHSQADFDHGSYFSRSLREYFDLEPYLHIQREAYKQRLLHGEA